MEPNDILGFNDFSVHVLKVAEDFKAPLQQMASIFLFDRFVFHQVLWHFSYTSDEMRDAENPQVLCISSLLDCFVIILFVLLHGL